MPADYKRVHRLLNIIMLLQSQEGWTAEKLAKHFHVTQRTIFRDMSILTDLGVPHFHDAASNGYRIRGDFFMPPVELTPDEALALLALGKHVGGRDQVPLTRAAARAIDKIRAQLPPSVQSELDQIEKHLAIELARSMPPESVASVYDHVRTALTRRRVMSCTYESLTAVTDEQKNAVFEFRPYALFFVQRAWYTVGFHGGRQAVRTLRLNRFNQAKVTDQPYAIPDDFNLDQHLGNAWRMIRGDKTYDVVVHFDAAFADTVSDTRWHRTQQDEFHEDGSATLRFKVDGLDEIVWWVLSMGPHARVLEPPELAQRVRELAQGVVQRYAMTSDAAESRAT